jgi:hypothetical protein
MAVVNSASSPNADQTRKLLRITRLARLLDSSIRVPGTRFRIGIDPLIGLVPGVGDIAAAALSAVIVVQAHRLGAPKPILTRMIGNVAIDWLIGTIPVLGDMFDFGFKCNTRNVQLLEKWLTDGR